MFSSHTTKIIPADAYAAFFKIINPKELTLSGSGFFVVNFGIITKINCIVSNMY